MSKISSDNYINIQGWMVTDLKLKGNELLVYAIIYGFTQDGQTKFTGSLQYLADWTNSTKQGIQKNLKSLVEQGLLLKEDYEVSGVKLCKYYAVVDGMQQSCIPIQQSCTNNIVNNKNKVLSKDNTIAEFDFGFLDEKPKKQNLYQKCISVIYDFTDDKNIQTLLVKYLDFVLEKYRNEGKTLYANQWKGMIKKLDSIQDKVLSVEQSLSKGYIGFYPVSNYNTYTNPDTNKAPQKIADVSNLMRNADGTLKQY